MQAIPDFARDIFELVSVPSVTGDEKAVADHLEKRLRGTASSRGNRVERVANSILVRPPEPGGAVASPADPPARKRPLILLAGHIDTVPRGEASDPVLEDGRIVGRGACDMKAGVAVMLALAEHLAPEEGFADRAFVFYTGEEGSAEGNALGRLIRSEPWMRGSDLGILLEPTEGVLELGCNGSIHLGVAFRGVACHSARPWMGRHPLKDALPWLERILSVPVREVELAGAVFREVATLTTVHGGEARNVVPPTITMNLNVRYAPDRTPAEAEAFARSLCPPEAIADTVLLDHSPAGRIWLEDPLYRHLCASTGLPRRAKQGWTDVSRLSAAGIPAINWGPGNPELAHTRDEFVEASSAEECFRRMAEFLRGPGPQRDHDPGRPNPKEHA